MIVVQSIDAVPLSSLSPVQIYREITASDAAASGASSYLLESREGIPRVARFSIIGFDPAVEISVKSSHLNIRFNENALRKSAFKRCFEPERPLNIVKAFVEGLNAVIITSSYVRKRLNDLFARSSEIPFVGGFVGYIAYDFVRYFVGLDERTADDLKHPDFAFILARKNIIFDHKERETFLLTNTFIPMDDTDEIKDAVDEADAEMTRTIAALNELRGEEEGKEEEMARKSERDGERDFTANMSEDEFKRIVKKAKEYIRAGDIFQVVLSQRVEVDFNDDHLHFYMRLSDLNPSPYMYFLDFGTRKIVGASPEMLVKVDAAFPWLKSACGHDRRGGDDGEGITSHHHPHPRGGRKVKSCPIAGTRPRGRDEREDSMLENEMLNDEKERAEHLMLVDLARNDIGKVSKFGTVSVPRFMYVEKFSHVQHIVSDVDGILRDDADEFDALMATFPAGTVSGAPKVRAMEIIEELETTRRGIYAGCVGYFSFNRAADTAITIRTAVFERGKMYVQAGAGIVADSVPEREYGETMNKCAAILACLP